MLLAYYFFMSGTLILALSNLQNSISFDKEKTKSQGFQDVKEYFANNIRCYSNPE
jgi:hypothetical protein